MSRRPWLEWLSDGGIIRDWLSLIIQFTLGMVYFGFLALLLSVGIALSAVIIGIPILLFALGVARTIALMDQQLMAAVLEEALPHPPEMLNLEGQGVFQRLTLLLSSPITWLSLTYVLLKLPLGLLALLAAILLTPLLFLDLLILIPLGIDRGARVVRFQRWLARAYYRFYRVLLPPVDPEDEYLHDIDHLQAQADTPTEPLTEVERRARQQR